MYHLSLLFPQTLHNLLSIWRSIKCLRILLRSILFIHSLLMPSHHSIKPSRFQQILQNLLLPQMKIRPHIRHFITQFFKHLIKYSQSIAILGPPPYRYPYNTSRLANSIYLVRSFSRILHQIYRHS